MQFCGLFFEAWREAGKGLAQRCVASWERLRLSTAVRGVVIQKRRAAIGFLCVWVVLAAVLCLSVPAYTMGGWNHDVAVFRLGDQGDDPYIYLDWLALLKRQGLLLGGLATIYCAFRAQTVRQRMWLLPGVLYLLGAVWRLLYVPCSVVVRHTSSYSGLQERVFTFRLWIWQADGYAVPRNGMGLVVNYGLVIFDEMVLLACLAAFYGLLYAISARARLAMRRALGLAH